MKSIIMPGHEQLDKKAKDQLFKEVKETVAKTTIVKDQNKKLFTVRKCGTGKDKQSQPVP